MSSAITAEHWDLRSNLKRTKKVINTWAQCAAVHHKEGETLEDVRSRIVTSLTQYASTHYGPEGEENFKYMPEYCPGVIENGNLEHPWNHYVQNKSVCRFMKRIYGVKPKETIMRYPEIMVRFFGSIEEGRNILALTNWDTL